MQPQSAAHNSTVHGEIRVLCLSDAVMMIFEGQALVNSCKHSLDSRNVQGAYFMGPCENFVTEAMCKG